MRPRLTVAIATLDRPEGLDRLLGALATGEERPDEILVVDQGRPERSAAAVARWAGEGLPVRRIEQHRRGLAASRNLAWRVAEGAAVAFTDDDCIPSPGWGAALHRAFAGPHRPDAVGGPMLPWGPPAPDRFAVSSRTGAVRLDFRGRAAPWEVGTGGNLTVRRDALVAVDGFDERLGAGSAGGAGEDLDLVHRLLRAGKCLRYEPDAIVHHERQSSTRRRSTRSSYGRGVGACCGLWLRGGDRAAWWVLGRWLALRGRTAAGRVRREPWRTLDEEARMLFGTLGGLAYGLRQGGSR